VKQGAVDLVEICGFCLVANQSRHLFLLSVETLFALPNWERPKN
jgi:hypothetical protein